MYRAKSVKHRSVSILPVAEEVGLNSSRGFKKAEVSGCICLEASRYHERHQSEDTHQD